MQGDFMTPFSPLFPRLLIGSALAVLAAQLVSAQAAREGAPPAGGVTPERIDYLAFAQGAVPVGIGGAGAKLGADFEAAVRITDGDATSFTVADRAPAETDTEFVYELPALTTFDRFAVPNIVETPSPTATFTKLVEVHGSSTNAATGFVMLASATLQTHRTRGLVTELQIVAKQPVRWVKLRLVGGINIMTAASSLEFSEIIGNGTQEAPQLATHFTGAWRTQANRVQLRQNGTAVTGCYDRAGDLKGTVSGNILHATGLDRSDKTPSAFILSVAGDGNLRGVRSTNGSPFRLYTLAAAPAGTQVDCGDPAPPVLGCGSIIHSITFAFDSAEIRPESAAVLDELYKGLQGTPSARIVIEGHTSSEGTEEYNDRLSERRAQAVVADLVRRGLANQRLSAAGIGERRPIATNNDENGRSLNRRVEVKCL
jgi:outer membrane protein OmpA-like peptidoglycan-associated protein